jgi:hypothetical protein
MKEGKAERRPSERDTDKNSTDDDLALRQSLPNLK